MDRLNAPETPQLAPADFAVEGATLHRLPVRVLTVAAVGLGMTTAIAGPAAAAAETRVPTVCVTDAAGEPDIGASIRITRPNGDVIEAGPVGRDGCVRLRRAVGRATIEATSNGITRTVTRSLGAKTLVVSRPAPLRVEARSWDGTSLSDVAVRYWADGWRDAARDGDAVIVELLEGETVVEVRRDGRRFTMPATVDGDTDVVVRLARLVPDVGAEIAEVDLGDGWRPFEDGMEVLPGRLAVRGADGTVTKLVIVGGTQTSLPSGRTS